MPAGVGGFISFHIRWHTEYFTMTAGHYFTSEGYFTLNVLIAKGHHSLVNQLERSATSIGANIHEANCAHGKPDFIAKLEIALKEANETGKWLEMLLKIDYIDEATFKSIDKTCSTIRILLIASIKTAKSKLNKNAKT